MVRMTQKDLADSTRAIGERESVSLATIQSIESGTTTPKPITLQRLSAGLVRDPFTGAVDAARAGDVYRQLLVAAGHIEDRPAEPEPERRRPVEDLTDEEVRDALTRLMQDPKVSAEFLSMAEDWADLAPSAQRFILNSFELARQMDEEVKAARARDDARPRRPRS